MGNDMQQRSPAGHEPQALQLLIGTLTPTPPGQPYCDFLIKESDIFLHSCSSLALMLQRRKFNSHLSLGSALTTSHLTLPMQ